MLSSYLDKDNASSREGLLKHSQSYVQGYEQSFIDLTLRVY